MKNKLLIIFSTLLLVGIILSANLARADTITCSPQINLVSQDPIPATPGSYVKVVFEVSNLYYCNFGVSVKLILGYPFSLNNGTDSFQSITSIPYATGNYKNVWDVGYTVRIADDAAGENYTLPLLYHPGTSSDFTSYSVEQDFNISITDERTTFDSVIQETSGSTVSIAIANIGKYAANSVIVKIPEQDNFKASGTDGQMVGNLASGDYTIVSFDITSTAGFSGAGPPTSKNSQMNQSSSSDSNKLKFEIYYTDNIGVRRVVNMQLPLVLTNSSLGNFSGRRPGSSWSVWYTILIILGVLVIGFILYKKFPKQAKKFISKINIFKRKKQQNYSPSTTEVPEWVKKEKEKEKKK